MNLSKFLACLLFIMFAIIYLESKKEPSIRKKMMSKERIEKILDVKVDEFPDEGVIKATFARTDIKVTVEDWPLDPFMGLSSWVGFQEGDINGIEAMIMGDIVLLEKEVNPVMSVA